MTGQVFDSSHLSLIKYTNIPVDSEWISMTQQG